MRDTLLRHSREGENSESDSAAFVALDSRLRGNDMVGWLGRSALTALALTATPAFAHPGHQESGLVSGILHPLTGADHLVAMLMVGLWAGLVAGRALWVLPSAFLAAMLGGFAYGALAQGGAAGAEMLIIASVLVLGSAVALRLRTPLALAGIVAGLFGFSHGMAHGLESPGGTAAFTFAGGFLVATAVLHGIGVVLARRIPASWSRGAGILAAGFGLVLAGAA